MPRRAVDGNLLYHAHTHFSPGVVHMKDKNPDHADFVSAIALAQVSDVIIFIGGLQATMEEEGA